MPISKFDKALGLKLKATREIAGLSQNKVASLMNVTRSCIGNYEQGTRTIDISSLIKICEIYEVDPNFLLKDIRHLVYEK